MADPKIGAVILGLPTDEASSALRGAAKGPEAARAMLYRDASNLGTESGLDLVTDTRWIDLGDAELSGGEATRREIEEAVAAQLALGRRILCLGGDHSVSHPILRAYAPRYPGLTVVQVDAHPDLYDAFEGDRHSHACPFARVMEDGLAARLVQVGIRAATPHQREQAQRFGVEWVPRSAWADPGAWDLTGPTYLSIDLDGIDPAFAPGVAHPEAGGLTPREVLDLVWSLPDLVGADVVELNPVQDVGGITAVLASKLVKEILSGLLGTFL